MQYEGVSVCLCNVSSSLLCMCFMTGNHNSDGERFIYSLLEQMTLINLCCY